MKILAQQNPTARSLLLLVTSALIPFILVSALVLFPFVVRGIPHWVLIGIVLAPGLLPIILLPWPNWARALTGAGYVVIGYFMTILYALVFACAVTRDCV